VLRWDENEWTVVGIFSSGGTVAGSELWCDANVLQPAYRRGTTFQSVYAKPTSPEAFDEFKDALTANPHLNVKVMRTHELVSPIWPTVADFVAGKESRKRGPTGVR